jgi:hypothetical protein
MKFKHGTITNVAQVFLVPVSKLGSTMQAKDCTGKVTSAPENSSFKMDCHFQPLHLLKRSGIA